MDWFDHSRIANGHTHAFLAPSSPHWLRYSEEKLTQTYQNKSRAAYGTRLHAFAQEAIELSVDLAETTASLNAFVNDANGFRMSSEVVLYHSSQCYGTADAISFDGSLLRIHDLKTGVSTPRLEQLEIYAALFCMEYDHPPETIDIVLRVYHNDEIIEWVPSPETITNIMRTIVAAESVLSELIHYDYA